MRSLLKRVLLMAKLEQMLALALAMLIRPTNGAPLRLLVSIC